MIRLLLAAAAPAAMTFVPPLPALAAHAAESACAKGGGPALHVDVSGLKDSSGLLRLELYPATAGDFLKDDNVLLSEGKVFRRVVSMPPRSGPVRLCVDAPGPGTYALVVIHDRDGQRRFDILHDGVGLAGSERLGRHRPAVTEAIVKAGSDGNNIKVRMQYMRGLRGFAPLDG